MYEVVVSTWSSRIWQTSGVKWRRAARVLLRILRRPYWTVCKARCSEASASATGCLEEQPDGVATVVVAVVVAGLCTRGVTAEGRPSPFLF